MKSRLMLIALLGVFVNLSALFAAAADNRAKSVSDPLAQEDQLPIGLTEEEKTRLHEIGINFQRTAPPPGTMRTCGEWEQCEKVLIRWPLGIPVSLVAEMSQDIKVVTIVANSSQQTSAISSYTSGGVNMANAEFFTAATNSIWTRDYGPWSMFDSLGNIGWIDHTYNRPRPQDDLIPSLLGSSLGIPVYALPITHTGGNHMSNGMGTSMSERLVYDENTGLSHAQVDAYMQQYLGNSYRVLEYVDNSGIHHIDCFAKFLDPNTILVETVPPSDAGYALHNARIAELEAMIGPWGRPYKIVKVYCPAGTAYTNSLILNKKVFVPTFSSTWDDSALQIYADAMPGYEILGFTGSWLSDDAIHCRAMGLADRKMLYVNHIPLGDQASTINPYPVTAFIYAHSDGNLINDSLRIYYSINGGAYQFAQMTATAHPDSFIGYIPAQPGGTNVRYFLKAADDSGRVATQPYIGESWAFEFQVTAAPNQAPSITSNNTFNIRGGEYFSFNPQYTDPDDSVHTVTYSGLPVWLIQTNDSVSGTAPMAGFVEDFQVEVSDEQASDSLIVTITAYLCGDADGNDIVTISDAVYLINYIFSGGPAPDPLTAGDADCNSLLTISDVVYMINYIFSGGSAPCALCP